MENSTIPSELVQPVSTRKSRKDRALRRRMRREFRLNPLASTSGRPQGENNETTAIPQLDFSTQVQAEGARLDKLTCKIDLGFIRGDSEDSVNICYGLRQQVGRIFNSPPFNAEGVCRLAIRKAARSFNGQELGRPLLGGSLLVFPKSSGTSFKFYGEINPTRALRFRPDEFAENGFDPYAMFRPIENIPPAPSALDGKNNVLPETMPQSQYLAGEQGYLQNISEAVLHEIRHTSEIVDGTHEFNLLEPTNYVIDDCEVYFEFSQDGAKRVLEQLEPKLMAFAAESRRLNHCELGQADEVGQNQQCRSIRLRPSHTVEIAIYAKCSNRLRFEVRFKKPSTNILERRSASQFSGFRDNLETLKAKATEKINELFSYLHEWAELPPDGLAGSREYSERWMLILGWSDASWSLLEKLRDEGVLHRGGCLSDDETHVLNEAKRKGLLLFNRAARGYFPNHSFLTLTSPLIPA